MIPFGEYSDRVKNHLEGHYGIRVVTRDVPDPLTGDLDGAEIHIDHAVTPEQRLFLLAHLFGHTVQWNANPKSIELGRSHTPPVPEALLPALMEYEKSAAGFALRMLHDIGIDAIDQWLSDYTACDMAYLHHFYRTGEKLDFMHLWRDGTPCLEPQPIPTFRPQRFFSRSDGRVV
jgi:hypothetical protein